MQVTGLSDFEESLGSTLLPNSASPTSQPGKHRQSVELIRALLHGLVPDERASHAYDIETQPFISMDVPQEPAARHLQANVNVLALLNLVVPYAMLRELYADHLIVFWFFAWSKTAKKQTANSRSLLNQQLTNPKRTVCDPKRTRTQ